MTRLAFIALMLSIAGCAETAPACVEPGFVRNDRGQCVPEPGDAGGIDGGGIDGGAIDGGRDAGEDAGTDAGPPDAGPCGPCDAATPICAEVSAGNFDCVECDGDGDCGAGVCAGNACVECRDHSGCTDPAAARCDAGGACVPCTEALHCAGTGASLCDAARTPATCVQCTLGDSSRCSAEQTCDLSSGRCVDVAPLSVALCGACTNDLQCIVGARCIRMTFEGAPHGAAGYCLDEAPGCARPYLTAIMRRSVNSVTEATYCGINEALTTCEAVRALEASRSCTIDGDCPTGGLCRDLGGGVLEDRCTYRCGSGDHCLSATLRPTESTCGNTGGGDAYCGG